MGMTLSLVRAGGTGDRGESCRACLDHIGRRSPAPWTGEFRVEGGVCQPGGPCYR